VPQVVRPQVLHLAQLREPRLLVLLEPEPLVQVQQAVEVSCPILEVCSKVDNKWEGLPDSPAQVAGLAPPS
jgi:hypothetical protein